MRAKREITPRSAALIAASAALLLLAAAAPSAQQSARIGVLVVGSDGLAAGALQLELESELRTTRDAVVVPASEIAAALGKPKGALPSDVAAQELEAASLDAAVAAYYDGRIDDAIAELARLEKLQDARVGVGTGERRRLRLWRAVALLAKEERLQAEVEVRSALAMDPDLQADLRVFPPSLREVVDAARTRGIPGVRVTLDGLPKGATVYADERPAGATFTVPAGRHWVWATAKGFRAVETSFVADQEMSVPLALPLLLDPEPMRLFVFQDAAAPPDVVAALAKARLDAAIVIADRGDARGVCVVTADGRIERGAPGALADVVTWSTSAASRTTRSIVAARRAAERSTWTIDVAVAARTVVDERRLSGSGPDTSFTGAGPDLAVEVGRSVWLARAGGAWTTFALTPYQVRFPDGTVHLLDGGRRTSVHAAAGARWIFGPGDAGFWPTAGLLLGARHTDHRADPLADERGDIGLFPSHVRDAVEARVIGGVPLRTRAGVLRVDAEIAAALHETLRERPASTGRDPSASGGLDALLTIGWKPANGAFGAALGYRVESGTDRFRGEAKFPSDPPLHDATSERRSQCWLLEVRRRF